MSSRSAVDSTYTFFAVGTSVEYKYKDKEWKNGAVIKRDKASLSLLIHKTITKQKEICLRMCDVMTCFYIKKTLKVSNQVYPAWIAVHTNVTILHSDGKTEYAKIAQYRDNKWISFYFPRQLEQKRLLKIKQQDITSMCKDKLHTNRFYATEVRWRATAPPPAKYRNLERRIAECPVFRSMAETLESSDFPLEISVIVYLFLKENCIRMYHQDQMVQHRATGKIWHVHRNRVYGMLFRSKRNFHCSGLEIHANFGKVKTYVILNAYLEGVCIKGVMDVEYGDEHLDVRRFRWENHKHVAIRSIAEYRIGFFISDGASVTQYADCTEEVTPNESLEDLSLLQWQYFEKSSQLKTVRTWQDIEYKTAPREDWHPLVRLLESHPSELKHSKKKP